MYFNIEYADGTLQEISFLEFIEFVRGTKLDGLTVNIKLVSGKLLFKIEY